MQISERNQSYFPERTTSSVESFFAETASSLSSAPARTASYPCTTDRSGALGESVRGLASRCQAYTKSCAVTLRPSDQRALRRWKV